MDDKLLNALQSAYFGTDRRGKWICTYTKDDSGDYEHRDYRIVEETQFGPATIIDGILNPADGMFIALIHNQFPEILQSLLNWGDKE